MIRQWFVASCVFAALVGACSKEDKAPPKSDPKPDPAVKAEVPAQQQAEKPADPPAPTLQIKASPNGDDLTLLPVDSELVLGVNFTQLSQSAVWKQFVEPRLLSDSIKTKLGEFKAKCGFDPMTAVKSLSVGVKGLKSPKVEGVVVVHGADKTKAMACMDKLKGEAKDKAEITRDGDVTVITPKSGEPLAFAFIDDDTAVVVLGAKANAAGFKAAAAGGSALRTSQAFIELFNKLDTQDSVWLLMNGNSPVFDQLAALGVKPKAIYGSANVTDGVKVDFRMRLESPDQATQMAQMGKSQANAAKSMLSFDKFDFASDGPDVTIGMAVSAAKLPAVMKQLKGMAGMAGGAPSKATP
jgi:hypothetical protein